MADWDAGHVDWDGEPIYEEDISKCQRCRRKFNKETYCVTASGSGLIHQEWWFCGLCYEELWDFLWRVGPEDIRERRRRAPRRGRGGRGIEPASGSRIDGDTP